MLLLLGLSLLLLIVLALVLTAWSLWLQGYLYTEPAEGMLWRAPAAAGAVMVPLLLWLIMARATPDTYRPLWEFNSTETTPPAKKVWAEDRDGKLREYRLVGGSRQGYHEGGNANAARLTSEPKYIIIEEDGRKVRFEPEKDAEGNLLRRKSTAWFTTITEPLRYVDDSGRVMQAGSLGQLTTFKGGSLAGNLMLNGLLFAACIAAFWPLLGFQWGHAMTQAVVLWLVLLLTVVPPAVRAVEAGAPPAAKAG
jgi:hypothetical protein